MTENLLLNTLEESLQQIKEKDGEDPFGGEDVQQQMQARASAIADWSKDFKVVIVIDTTGPLTGQVQFDAETKCMYVGLAEGMTIESTDWSEVYEAWENRLNNPQVPAVELFKFRFDSSAQRTCAHFTPSKEYVDSFGAEVHPDYDFDRPHDRTVCHNPAMMIEKKMENPPCSSWWWQGGCDVYEYEEQILIASYDVEDGFKIEVMKGRNGQGIPTFTAYQVFDTYRSMIWKLPLTQYNGDLDSVKAKTEWLYQSLNSFIQNYAENNDLTTKVLYKMEDPFTDATPVTIPHRKLLENVCRP